MPRFISETHVKDMMLSPQSIKLAALESCNFCRETYKCPNSFECKDCFKSTDFTINAITSLRSHLWQVIFLYTFIHSFQLFFRAIELVNEESF